MDAADLMLRVADGVRLHVRRWPGRSDKPPFLLVHGLSSNARLWDGVAVRLSALDYPVYAVDLRSHGESERPPAGYDTATAVADLAAIVTTLQLPPVVTAGQSWGGNVVVAYADAHPDQVRALAGVDGGWIDLPDEFDSFEACAQVLHPPELDGVRELELLAFIRRVHPDWEEWAVRATTANFRTQPDGRLCRRLAIPQHMQILRSMWDDPPGRHYPGIKAPTLLLPAVPTDPAQAARQSALVARAAAAIPRATVKEYPGADHDLHAQHAAAIAADLLELTVQA